jgi:hypothetical protein
MHTKEGMLDQHVLRYVPGENTVYIYTHVYSYTNESKKQFFDIWFSIATWYMCVQYIHADRNSYEDTILQFLEKVSNYLFAVLVFKEYSSTPYVVTIWKQSGRIGLSAYAIALIVSLDLRWITVEPL